MRLPGGVPSLRARLMLLGVAGLAYVVAVSAQLGSVLVPAVREIRSRTRDLLGDHDRIAAGLRAMRAARREVARYVPPYRDDGRGLRDLAGVRREVLARLDDGVSLRTSVDRAAVPLEMRVLLAEALQQETALAMEVLETIRAVELLRPAEGVEPLRRSGIAADSSSVLLSAAQRVALASVLADEERLAADVERLQRWALVWLGLGLLLFAWGAWELRVRLLQPVRALEGAVGRIRDGDLGTRLAVARRDELGRLAELVNDMAAMLRARAAEETARRESITERFGRLLDESSNEIGIFDAASLSALQLNRGARLNLGYGPDEVGALTLPGLLRAQDPASLREQLDRLRTGGQRRLFLSTRQVRKDGSSYPVEMSIQYSRDRDAELFITVSEDAGVRERARELDRALRDFSYAEQQRRDRGELPATLHAIAGMAAEALGVPRVTVWRESGTERTCVGSSLRPLPVGGERAAFPADPRHLAVTVPASARGGTLLVVEAPAPPRPFTAEEQTFARAVATLVARAVDAAERQSLEQALARAQRLESIGQLAGGIAHDFNNILTAILGNLELARTATDDEAGRVAAIGDAEEAARRAADLTRQLLTFARHQRVEARVVDLNALTRDAERMLQRLVGPELEIVADLAADLRPVYVAPSQLEQVLVNLVVNARDATPRGGRITLATRNRTFADDGTGELARLAAGEYVELTVRDTGAGMSAEVIERAFDPFFTTKAPGAGTGLGLAVCYGIVRQAGGAITVESTPGAGATFRVLLPAAASAPEGPPPAEAPADARGGETVLVVEDEAAIRALVVRALSRLGYAVLEAGDGQAALDVAAGHPGGVDLLVSDVVMPNLGGAELARALRARWPALPVLFMSGYTADALREGRDIPDSDFLAKPFTPEALCRRVRALLDGGPVSPRTSGPMPAPVLPPEA